MNNHRTRDHFIWLTGTAVLTLIFLHTAAANLANYYPVSADDAWIMSASYKLADQGIFGSDLYTGFFNAENYYFIALPVHHFLQAASFKFFGLGVAQARLPALAGAVLLIWVMSSLAYRRYGWKVALLTAVLLVFWRSDLTSSEPRVPLLAFAHAGRYDIMATALVWTAVWLLDELLHRPSPLTALGLGLTAGLATLTQFFGGFILLPVAAAFWQRSGKGFLRQRTTYLFAFGFLLVVLPYFIYILAHFDDFIGQSSLKSMRVQFWRLSFYGENLLREPERFMGLIRRQGESLFGTGDSRLLGPWLVSVSLVAAVYYLVKTTRSDRGKVRFIPWISLFCFAAALALFDQTKAPIYAILLVPGLCLALAAAGTAVLQWLWQIKRPLPIRLAASFPFVVLLVILLREGINSHQQRIRQAQEASSYLAVGKQIENAVAPGAVVLGAERWWLALIDYPYLALNNLLVQWRLAEEDGRSPSFAEQVKEVRADFIIINSNVSGDLAGYPVPLQTQFWSYLAQCGTLVAVVNDASYGRIEVYRLAVSPDC